MNFCYKAIAVAMIMTLCQPAIATVQEEEEDTTGEIEIRPLPPKKFYWSNGLDAAIFSTSTLSRPGKSDVLTTPRFSYVINFGFNFNYDLHKNFGLFTGIGIKNIGFIEKFRAQDSTVKRRLYVIGAPLGIKAGNLSKRRFVFAGGGVDLTVNYREKGFIRRGHKDKFNEWFSARTPLILPYVFAGMSFEPGITAKLQYYPGNFFNTDYTETTGTTTTKPYAGYEVHLIYLSVGFDFHYNKVPKMKKKDGETKTM